MELRNLLFTGAAIAALGSGFAIAADDQIEQTRQLNMQELEKTQTAPAQALTQVGPEGLPATSEEKARTERAPRDMSPDTGDRVAQSERPGDQRMTTPLPPTTGTEANAVTLSQVERPDKTLVNAPVEGKDGRKIGEVAQVTLDANGKASEVVLNDRNSTRLGAGEVVFQPERGVLITQLSPSDLAPALSSKSPAAPPGSTSSPDARPGQNSY